MFSRHVSIHLKSNMLSDYPHGDLLKPCDAWPMPCYPVGTRVNTW